MNDRHQMKLAIAALKEVYERLPKIECKGLCWDYCTLVGMAPLEYKRFHDAGGRAADARVSPYCGALDPKTRRCAVYSCRPYICRAFGVVEGLTCPHGCKPQRLLSPEEAYPLFEEIARISEESGIEVSKMDGQYLDMQTAEGIEQLRNFVSIDQLNAGRIR